MELTWLLAAPYSGLDQQDQIDSAERAFALWADASTLSFTRVGVESDADISISFSLLDHGDDFPFDGPGSNLGHAFFPGSGMPGEIHLCAAETWGVTADAEFILFIALLHEIGHALGLEHSLDPDAVMWPSYREGISELTEDDVNAIQRLYGSPDGAILPITERPEAFREFCADADALLTARGDPDTDGDGIPDTIEVFVLNTDPLEADSDGDNVNDITEVLVDQTDPTDPSDVKAEPEPEPEPEPRPWAQKGKLVASDGVLNDSFGSSVAIFGDTAVIGAGGAFSRTPESAYVFRFDGSSWVEEAKLLASDGSEGDFFGSSVGISGDTAVIAARTADGIGPLSGSAYIFRFDGSSWVEEAKLLASAGSQFDAFGNSVGISGNTVVIGAFQDDDGGPSSGSAYVFRFDGSSWVQEPKLLASDASEFVQFGRSVGISGDTVVIGADGAFFRFPGSVYVFRFDGSNWVQEAKLLASDASESDNFGSSVSVSGDTVVIGADRHDDNGLDSGAAYVFRFDGSSWVEEAKLLASDGSESDFFGRSVSISGDTVVIGALGHADNGDGSGSAYVFRFNGSSWVQEAKLLASDGGGGDAFGISLGISGDTVVIGASGQDDNGSLSGATYVFTPD